MSWQVCELCSCFLAQIFAVPEDDIKQLELEGDDSVPFTSEVCFAITL